MNFVFAVSFSLLVGLGGLCVADDYEFDVLKSRRGISSEPVPPKIDEKIEIPVEYGLLLVRATLANRNDDRDYSEDYADLSYSSTFRMIERELAHVSKDRSPLKEVPNRISKALFKRKVRRLTKEGEIEVSERAPRRFISPHLVKAPDSGSASVVFGLLTQDLSKLEDLNRKLEEAKFDEQQENGRRGSWTWKLEKLEFGVSEETLWEIRNGFYKEKCDKVVEGKEWSIQYVDPKSYRINPVRKP